MGDLYLGPERSKARWLLDPDNPEVIRMLAEGAARQHTDTVDPLALADDLPDLLTLLRERHSGLAMGVRDETGLPELFDAWAARLRAEQPTTWGTALQPEAQHIRNLLRDNHFGISGEDQTGPGLRLEPRFDPHDARDERNPIVEVREIGEWLYVRLRRLYGKAADIDALRAWSRRGGEHFGHRRIVLDVRGNPGGDDTWTYEWMRPHLPVDFDDGQCLGWELSGQPLIFWNALVAQGADASPEWLARRPAIGPDVDAEFLADTDTDARPGGGRPWQGHLVVVTDRGSGSSAESTAWRLHRAFGATIAGSASYGAVAFGNLTPYLLGRSGAHVHVPSMATTMEPFEMVGLPVELPLDVTKPIEELLPTITAYVDGRAPG